MEAIYKGIKKSYNSKKEFEATSTGRVGTIMTEGGITTLEECIELIEFTIARNKDYKTVGFKKYEKDG